MNINSVHIFSRKIAFSALICFLNSKYYEFANNLSSLKFTWSKNRKKIINYNTIKNMELSSGYQFLNIYFNRIFNNNIENILLYLHKCFY